MPTIADLRTDYPELGDLDDEQLVGAVHQALYADLPRERVASHFGLKPRPVAPVAAAAPPPSGPMRRAADVALSIGKGVIGVPEAIVGMVDLATGGRAGRAVEQAGVRFKDAKAVLDDYMSPEAKAAQEKFQQSTGVLDAVGTAVTNPSLIVNAAAESLPMMGMGGAIARPLMAAAPGLGALGGAAAGEGIAAAGSGAEQIRQQTPDGLLTPVQSGVAAVSGAATGLLGVLGGKIAQRMGIADVDTLIAGGAGATTTKGFVRRVLEGAAAEGLLEELPQSIQEQVAQNYALGKPLDEGVVQAAVLGALTGGAMGGAVNVFAGKPPAGPMQRAVETVVPPAVPTGEAPLSTPGDQAVAPGDDPLAPGVDPVAKMVPPEAVVPTPDADGVVPPPAAAPVQPPLIDPVAQREADRPPEPTEQPQPGDILSATNKPFTTMPGALRALKGRKDTHEVKRVVGGLVLRAKPGAMQDAAAPVQADSGSAASAPVAAAPSEPGADDLKRMGFNPAGPGPGEWVMKVSNLGDVIAKVVSENPLRVEISADYMGKRLGTRVAEGDAAIQEAIDTARNGINAGRQRMAQSTVEGQQGAIPNVPIQPTRTDAQTTPPAAPPAQAPAPAAVPAAEAAGSVPDTGLPAGVPPALETRGVAGEAIDSEWTAFAPETGTKGIPRADMPQVKAEHRGALTQFLKGRGIAHQQEAEVEPGTLKPTQAEFSPAKVRKAREFTGGDRAILVSNDGHVVDGHHQWAAALDDGKPIRVIRLDAPIDELLPVVKEFPSAEAAAGATAIAPAAPSAQFESYRKAIDLAEIVSAGMVEQINKDERLEDGEAERLVALAQPKLRANGAKISTEPEKPVNLRKGASSANSPLPPPAPPRPAGLPTAQARWDAFMPMEREKALLAAGWKAGSAGTMTLRERTWDQLKVPQRNRLAAAMGLDAAPAVSREATAAAETAPAVSPTASSVPEKQEVVTPAPKPSAGFDNGQKLAQAMKASKPQPTANTIVTEDAAERARALLRKKLGQVSTGIDPEVLQAGITLAAYHVERGARKFAAYARAMVDDMGDIVKPYLQSWYMAMRSDPAYASLREGMDKASAVEDLDVDQVLAESGPRSTPEERERDLRPIIEKQRADLQKLITQRAQLVNRGNEWAVDEMIDKLLPGLNEMEAAVGDPLSSRSENGPDVETPAPVADTAPQETPTDDPAPPTPAPAVDRPLAEGLGTSTEPARGAEQPRDRAGRPDDRGVRGARGPAEGVDDEGRNVGDGQGPDPVPDRPNGALAGGDQRVPARDFRPEPGGLTREGSWFATAARNIDLIELAIRIDGQKRDATPEEQAQLSKYVGFGAGEIRNNLFPVPSAYQKQQDPERLIWPNLVREARWKPLAERLEALPVEWQRTVLQSTQYAHYTSEPMVRSIWSAVQRLGFTGGRMFEPGGGIGNFTMLMPDAVRKGSKYTSVEFDGSTALIARLLSPQQNMLHADFIKRKFPKDYFDLAIGNPPFSQTPILGDPDYEKHKFFLHDFFFAKTIDRVRPGGLLAFVTSKGTMDKQTDKARKYLAERADLVGAIRLPSTAFEANAGTSVVTDVIFLRKRAPGDAPAGPAWQGVATVQTPDGPVVINEYFAARPEMILGQNRISGNQDDEGRRINSNGYGGEKYTVVSYDKTPAELDAKFAVAVERLPANIYSPLQQTPAQVKRETAKVDFDPSVKREGVVYVGKDGTLMRVQNGVGVGLSDQVKLSAKDAAWFKSYVGIRDLVQIARAEQVSDGKWEAALKKLNAAYDAFRKAHGPINAFRTQVRKSTDEEGNPVETEIRIFTNRRLFREDYDAAIVTQLETINEAGEVVKAPFLKGRTIGKPVTREVKTIGDALAVSLDEGGRLDLDDIARRMGISRDDAIEALGNQVYRAPAGDWQLADEYLSGDVVSKLEEAEQAARIDASLSRNVDALKAVQPEKLGPSQISVKAGASWVPAQYVNEFATLIEAGAVTFDPKTESWQVEGGNLRSGRKAGAEYGTADKSPSELLDAVLNSRAVVVKRTTADKKTETDAAATTAAQEAMKKIKDKFKSWVWTDAERATSLVEAYNQRFNNIAPRRFDGSHLTLPGVSLRYSLHPHQKRAIWRQIQTGNTYLAHAVGAGKTIEMIAGGMEQKRLGLIRKPVYAVPNHMLEQFANEFMELYPLANIMVADDENFSAERRKAFVAAATLNAPDAIIITHSAFERIGVKEETVAPIRDEILLDLQVELDDVGKGDRVRRSQFEQQIEAVTQRFDSIAGVGKKDSTIKFEDIGADFVYVDEAHAFRKLDFTTNQKVKGIDPNGSRRALDMYVKTRHLEKLKPGRAMVFASGTAVTNTMGELYTIMRFFAPQELDRAGISTFDAWSRQFGEVVPALEANAAGRYEVVERFAKFDNVPELMSRVRQFMDVLTSESLGALVKRPDIEGGKPDLLTVEPTPMLKAYMKQVLLPRLEKSKRWKPSFEQPFNPDPVIAITSDGRFAALDPRFFGADIDEDTTPTKLTRMADEIARVYAASADNEYLDRDGKPEAIKGSTQIVFYNLGFGQQSQKNRGFDARAALTRRMVAQGVKREHILWFDDANTDAKKEAMFKAMRSGQARVLVGSAKKMGTGVNVQKRLLALHYFDPPWYPSDVEQPHGRIIRQGNQNEVATIKWYATKGTYDSTMWQMVGRKQRFIDQAFSGDKALRSMEDMSEASMFEQAAAVASGDPRALQLAGLRQDVERMERLQAAHASEQIGVRSALRSAEWAIESAQNRIQTYGKAFKVLGERYFAFSTGQVGARTFDKPGEFGQAVKDAFNKKAAERVLSTDDTPIDLATLGPMQVRMHPVMEKDGKPAGVFELVLHIGEYQPEILQGVALGADVDAVGLARRLVNAANGVETNLAEYRRQLTANQNDVTRLRKKLGAPFEYQQELAEKYGELKRLEEELRAEGEAESRAAAAAANAPVVRSDGTIDGESAPRAPGDEPDLVDVVASRRAEPSPAEQHRDRITALAEAIAAGWANGPKVVVARNLRDPRIPERVRAEDQKQRSSGAAGDPEGFFYQGTAYLLTDQLGSAKDAVRVLFHEALGHYGLRGTFGPALGPILDRIAVLQAGKVRAKAAAYGLDFDNPRERRQAAEEVLAEMAQTQPELGWVQKAVAAIRTWLREHVPGFATMRVTDDEIIRSYILPARGWVERGRAAAAPRAQLAAASRFSRAQQTDTAAFKAWFGDSKVVDAGGKPLVVYHGTTTPKDFTKFRVPAYFTSSADAAQFFGEDAALQDVENAEQPGDEDIVVGSRLMPVYLAVKNPLKARDFGEFMEWDARKRTAAEKRGFDGVTLTMPDNGEQLWMAFRPEQIKSAIGNRGTFDPADPDIRFSRSTTLGDIRSIDQQAIRNHVADLLGGAGAKVSWWQKTVGTQYAKAQKHLEFGRVFDAVQTYLEDVSTLANRAANEAPAILPKLDNWKDLKRSAAEGLGLQPADVKALAGPVFEGTLGYTRGADGRVMSADDADAAAAAMSAEDKARAMVRAGRLSPDVLRMWQGLPIEQFEAAVETRYRNEMMRTGVVWTDAELRERFQLTDEQIGHYRQYRAAVDRSLDQMVAADVLRLLGDVPPGFKSMAVHAPVQLRAAVEEYLQQLRPDDTQLWNDVADRFNRIDQLKEQGYAPLMRFGKFKVHVTGADGETLFFGLYETAREANRMVRELREDPDFAGASFTQGVLSQEAYKLFSQVPPESLEMFAEALGAERSAVFQEYLRLAKNNRSALKRLIRRKGTAGFSEDAPRVLASFVTSNARLGAAAMNLPGAKAAAEGIRDGDVQDEAVKLIEAVQNPTGPAAAIRGLMFMNFIGGSVASAVVNLTQPITMTLPYLSQFGGLPAATKRLMAAAGVVAAGTGQDTQLAAALAGAEADGIVSPQEIHHLQAQAMSTWGMNPLVRRAAFIWSAPFSLAEQWNRRVSFIAAYNTARERGDTDAFGFAERAVIETQGLYNTGNAANWARNPAGALALQFKQYSVHYLEWMVRMWKSGPEGKKAVGIALLLLAAAGGSDGLPFAEDIDDLVDTIRQALGYDSNFKRSRREFIAKDLGLGDMVAEVATRGLSALPGIPMDVSLRMGMGNLLPATGLLLRSNTDRSRDVLEIAGPAGGLAKQYSDAATKALEGDLLGGARTALPVALQNAAKAAGMWSTGEARDEKGRRVMEADAVDGFMRFLGFNPANIARESQRMGMIRRSEQLAKNIEGGIVERWARAIVEKDPEAIKAARAELVEWNQTNPSAPIRITIVQVRQRARKMMQDRSERFLKSVSPERRVAATEALQ